MTIRILCSSWICQCDLPVSLSFSFAYDEVVVVQKPVSGPQPAGAIGPRCPAHDWNPFLTRANQIKDTYIDIRNTASFHHLEGALSLLLPNPAEFRAEQDGPILPRTRMIAVRITRAIADRWKSPQ